jgi:hypothetical protein
MFVFLCIEVFIKTTVVVIIQPIEIHPRTIQIIKFVYLDFFIYSYYNEPSGNIALVQSYCKKNNENEEEGVKLYDIHLNGVTCTLSATEFGL